jgi:hypothetical protein
MRDNEKVQHPSLHVAPAGAALNSQHLKSLDSMIPKDKKNITTLNLSTAGRHHMTINTYFCDVLISGKSDPSKPYTDKNNPDK